MANDTTDEGSAPLGESAPPIPAWRYKTGLGLFVIGNLIVPLSPLVPLLGLPAKAIPVVIVAGEIMLFGSIPFLGKQGFLELKNKLKSLFRRSPDAILRPVARWRHVTGLVLAFVVPLITQVLVMAFGYALWSATSLEQPFPEVWGLGFDAQFFFFEGLLIGGEVCIVVGLILLGGLWWERFRQLFVWPGEELEAR